MKKIQTFEIGELAQVIVNHGGVWKKVFVLILSHKVSDVGNHLYAVVPTDKALSRYLYTDYLTSELIKV